MKELIFKLVGIFVASIAMLVASAFLMMILFKVSTVVGLVYLIVSTIIIADLIERLVNRL